MDETVRERLIKVLLASSEPLTIYQLQALVETDLKPNELYDELEHVRKTLKRRGYRLDVVPATCKKCGYQFTDRERLKKPSRCPRCKSERIDQPRFYVKPLY
jgi:predicted Zn-ribbon and HTH transcriptional regulator